MPYDLYPAVDENYQFPPEVRSALSISPELRNTVLPMTTVDRNNLTPDKLWDGRVIANTTTDHLERYDAGTGGWIPIAEYVDIAQATPTGAILAFASSVPPAGWALCNGSVHGSAALEAVLTAGGHANPTQTPNLIDRFILGRGGAQPSSGGAATVKLTAAQSGSPAHAHTATAGNDTPDHAHPVNPPSTKTSPNTHTHSLSLKDGSGSGTGDFVDSNPNSDSRNFPGGTVGSSTHDHTVDIAQFNSLGATARHSHAITVNPSAGINAAEAHENMPPYYALTYIIKL